MSGFSHVSILLGLVVVVLAAIGIAIAVVSSSKDKH